MGDGVSPYLKNYFPRVVSVDNPTCQPKEGRGTSAIIAKIKGN